MNAETATSRIIAVIVQYGNWRDTALCVESVLTGEVVPDWIVVVDNASPDDSAEKFLAWARGEIPVASPDFLPLCPSSKPLPFTELSEPELSKAGKPETRCVFVRMPRNGGYAAGNNAGLRLGLQWGADAFLILNNDTIVTAIAIRAMRDRLFTCHRPGLCGALLRYCHDEQLVQCLAGGRTDPRTALSRITGQGLTLEEARRVPRDKVEAGINYICGACVMASREFVENVGLLDEGYFLYCEEQDWAYRAAGRFDLAYAPEALVWHKEGETTGWNGRGSMPLRPLLRLTASRLRCTWRHHPQWLPTVMLGIMYAALHLTAKSIFGHIQLNNKSTYTYKFIYALKNYGLKETFLLSIDCLYRHAKQNNISIHNKKLKSELQQCHYIDNIAVNSNSCNIRKEKIFPATVILHCFYPDKLHNVLPYLQNFLNGSACCVSTNSLKNKNKIKNILLDTNFSNIEVQIFPNCGFDIAPFFVGFRDIINSNDIILKLHIKQSEYLSLDQVKKWTNFYFDALLRSNEHIQNILRFFMNNERIGMLAPKNFLEPLIGMNFYHTSRLLSMYGIKLKRSDTIDFPVGSMFWCRTKALRPWINLNLRFEDFENSASSPHDGTLAHALERLMFFGCHIEGFSYGKIA